SRSYGCKLFKKYLGKTFREALREVRIGKAKSLLEETLLPISEIAESSGFHSSSRFREAFKRLYGISPRAYRQKMNETIS
ncbi:helix-turn-helix transcriptional regulator, partial [Candidatus Poribacteria bacterium]|nr:helix-turn-helix transcriptional regulator [Candidatus Poribacteria bacterium]